jgi:hypothetical protein
VLSWLRRPRSVIPVTDYRPGELVFPFSFPLVTVDDESMVKVHRTPDVFMHLPEDVALAGQAPKISIVTDAGRMWRPARILAMARTGRQLFGRNVVQATFEFEEVGSFGLDDLRATARAAVQNDPDDLWNQVLDHEEILRAIDAATSFPQLLEALDPAARE